jgi:hypothetical protein
MTYDRAVRVLTPDSLQSDIKVAPSAQTRADGAPLRGDDVQPSHAQRQSEHADGVPAIADRRDASGR